LATGGGLFFAAAGLGALFLTALFGGAFLTAFLEAFSDERLEVGTIYEYIKKADLRQQSAAHRWIRRRFW
jgi:hypothetical protein